MTNLPSEGLGRLAILIVAAALTACGSSVILEGDGDGRGDDEGGDVTVPGGSDGSGPGAEPACAPGASLQEIAPWEGASSFIALHDGWVYWATEATVERAPRAGGGPVEVVASPAARPLGIDVDDGGVFIVVDDGTLIRVGHQGGVATILATGDGLGGAFGVVRVDDQHAYHRQSCGELARVPKHGGAVEIVAETAGCFGGFEIDEEHLYVVDQVDGSVTRVAKDGGATLLLAGGSIAKAGGYSGTTVGLALDDDAVYWVSATGGFVGAVAKVGGDVSVRFEDGPAKVALGRATYGRFGLWVLPEDSRQEEWSESGHELLGRACCWLGPRVKASQELLTATAPGPQPSTHRPPATIFIASGSHLTHMLLAGTGVAASCACGARRPAASP